MNIPVRRTHKGRWGSLLAAALLAWSSIWPAAARADSPSITPDTPIFYDRVDQVYPDANTASRMLDFFEQNLILNQQPDGRFDNFPQKVYVSGGKLTAGNIVSNFGFEQGDGTTPSGWSVSGPEGSPPDQAAVKQLQDVSAALEGSGYLRMDNASAGSLSVKQEIANPVEVNVDYTNTVSASVAPSSLMILSAFYQAEQADPAEGGQGVYAKVSFLDEKGGRIGSPFLFQGEAGRFGWQEIRGLVTVPSTLPASILIEAGMDHTKGTVLWDGIRLMRVDTTTDDNGIPYAAKGTEPVPNAGFEDNSVWKKVQENGGTAAIDVSADNGYRGKSGRIQSNAANTSALLSNTLSASGNGTRQFGGDYRIFSVKYRTDPGFTAADGGGVEARIVYLDKNKKQIGETRFPGAPTNGQWGEISGVFDTPYPVHQVRIELRVEQAQGTVMFDDVAYIGIDQQASSTEAGFGAAGLLAYQWNRSGKTGEMLAKRARDGLDFYLQHRVTAVDNPANAGKLLPGAAGSGEYYVPYRVNGSTTGADYPTTAFALHNLATALTYGQELFTAGQLEEGKTKALSMWRWLTGVSQFNPQQSMNQTLVALLGGIQMAELLDDDGLKQDIRDYYAAGLDGTNLPPSTGGVRQAARQEVDGRHIFYEVNGFDVSYAGVSLSDLAGILQTLPDEDPAYSGLKPLLYQDGLEMADAFNSRLSADGWIFAGSRHNEGGSSVYNMGNFSGLSFWGQALQADLGRFLIKSFSSDTWSYGDTANLGHLAVHGPVQMNETLSQYPWKRAEQQRQEELTLRKGQVSAYFHSDTGQPLTLSVSGTDFTESLLNTGVDDPDKPGFPKIGRLNGWYAKTAAGNLEYDDIKHQTTYYSTPNYLVRLDEGVSSGGANSTKQFYITDGTSMYNILAVRFSSTQSFLSLGQLIGLPYMSVPPRPYVPGASEPDRVRINGLYKTDGTPLLDLTKDEGTATAQSMVAGTARITGYPLLKAENAPAGGASRPTWLSAADLNALSPGFISSPGKIMDDLYTKALWDPTNVRNSPNNGSIVQFADSDKLSVQAADGAAAVTYREGDWVYFVSKIEPAAEASGFTAKAAPKYAGRSDVLNLLTVSDESMKVLLSGGHCLFIDKKGKAVLADGVTLQAKDLVSIAGQKQPAWAGAPELPGFPWDVNADGAIDAADFEALDNDLQ